MSSISHVSDVQRQTGRFKKINSNKTFREIFLHIFFALQSFSISLLRFQAKVITVE